MSEFRGGAHSARNDPGNTQSESDNLWLRRLIGYAMRRRKTVFLSFGAALVGMALSAVTPLIVRDVVDNVILHNRQSLMPWLIALLVVGAARFGFGFVRRYEAGRLAVDVQYDMRTEVYQALQRLDGAKQDDLQTGQVVSRAISDLQLVQGLLGWLPMLTGNLLMFVLSLVFMLTLSPLLTLIALAIAPALWLVAYHSRKTLFPANWDAQQRVGEVAEVVEAAVTGVRVVKGFGQERHEQQRLESAARGLFAARLRT